MDILFSSGSSEDSEENLPVSEILGEQRVAEVLQGPHVNSSVVQSQSREHRREGHAQTEELLRHAGHAQSAEEHMRGFVQK